MTKPILLPVPNEAWVHRLRRGNHVWLAKENELAAVEWEYEPPEPGRLVGRICISRYQDNRFTGEQTWFISDKGCGLNGSLLFIPIEGHLPENPPELPITELRRINRELEKIKQRLRQVEDSGWRLYTIWD